MGRRYCALDYYNIYLWTSRMIHYGFIFTFLKEQEQILHQQYPYRAQKNRLAKPAKLGDWQVLAGGDVVLPPAAFLPIRLCQAEALWMDSYFL